jgi:hypothetical protein
LQNHDCLVLIAAIMRPPAMVLFDRATLHGYAGQVVRAGGKSRRPRLLGGGEGSRRVVCYDVHKLTLTITDEHNSLGSSR